MKDSWGLKCVNERNGQLETNLQRGRPKQAWGLESYTTTV